MRDKIASLKKWYKVKKTKRHRYYHESFFKHYTTDEIIGIDSLSCISEKYKFFYSRIPKAANSTIINTLTFATLGKTAQGRSQINKFKAKSFSKVTDTKITFGDLNQLYTFTFVRHPADRIVSAFNHKMIDATGYERISAQRDTIFADDTRCNSYLFDIFLEKLEDHAYLIGNYHWTPQVRLLLMPIHYFDFIGTLDSLETDLGKATKDIFGKAVHTYNWVEHSVTFSERYVRQPLKFKDLNISQKRKLEKIYVGDFDMYEIALDRKNK